MTGSRHPVAIYEGIAPFYDRLLGRAGFASIWKAFERARRRFAIGWFHRGGADFGCGTGLFLQALAKAAPGVVPLYGIDRSRAMLAEARRRLATSGEVMMIHADIRVVRLPRPVELISCNFNTINYFRTPDALTRIIGNFALNLGYEGFLVFDMLATGRGGIKSAFKQQIRLPGLEAEWRIAPRPDDRGSITVMHNCVHRGGARWHCWTENHVQRWWPVAEIVSRLEASGFRCLAVTPVEAHSGAGSMGRWVQVVARRLG